MYKIIITDTVTNKTLVDDVASCVIGALQLTNNQTQQLGFCQDDALGIACCIFGAEQSINQVKKIRLSKKRTKWL